MLVENNRPLDPSLGKHRRRLRCVQVQLHFRAMQHVERRHQISERLYLRLRKRACIDDSDLIDIVTIAALPLFNIADI